LIKYNKFLVDKEIVDVLQIWETNNSIV